MITNVSCNNRYVDLAISVVDENGIEMTPLSVTAQVFKQNEVGALVLHQDNIVLAKTNNETGFYSAVLDVSEYASGQYTVLFKTTTEIGESHLVDSFDVEGDAINSWLTVRTGLTVQSAT